MTRLRRMSHLADLAALVQATPGLHVRYSEGPETDSHQQSVDAESGLTLPGLSVNPLDAEAWWTRPLEDWLARQLCQYQHLAEDNPERVAWILRGRMVGRGPDCEPLLADVEPLVILDSSLLTEAQRRYEQNFDAGKGPED